MMLLCMDRATLARERQERKRKMPRIARELVYHQGDTWMWRTAIIHLWYRAKGRSRESTFLLSRRRNKGVLHARGPKCGTAKKPREGTRRYFSRGCYSYRLLSSRRTASLWNRRRGWDFLSPVLALAVLRRKSWVTGWSVEDAVIRGQVSR